MITIKTDSRKIKKGDTFVAVKCEQNDGHKYIEKAIENGASKIVCEHGNYSVPTLVVKDTRAYLEETLKKEYSYIFDKLKLIGITGTNGKTTTAYITQKLFNKLGIKTAYIGTIGYYIDEKIMSLPNTSPDIADMYSMFVDAYEKGCKYVVLEASSQGLDAGRLHGIKFDYAVFTNLTQDHLDYHKNMENYANAKKILFDSLKENGKSIINIDDPYYIYYVKPNTITYGFNESDYQITSYKLNPSYSIFKYKHNNEENEIKLSIPGKHNIYNALVSIILASEIGKNYDEFKSIMNELDSPDGRMNTIKYKDSTIIIDYAHTPDAVEKILNTAREMTKNNIYTVFGCTGDRDRTKRPIMMGIVTNLSTKAIVTVDDLHNEEVSQIIDDMLKGNKNNNYEIELDRKEAIRKGMSYLKRDDILLILGKGHEEFIIVKDKKIPHNDMKAVKEIMNEEDTSI